jgi:hypothetical protein
MTATFNSIPRKLASIAAWTVFAGTATAAFFYGSAWTVGLVGPAFGLFDLG